MKFPIKLPRFLTRTVGKLALKVGGSKPEICIISGIAFGTAAVIATGIRTWKGKETLQTDIQNVKEDRQLVKAECEDEAVVKERKAQLVKSVMKTGKDIFKIYWLPAALGGSAICLVWGGRTFLRKELSALTASYALLAENYKRYREKVIAEFGAEKDQEFLYGAKIVDSVDGDTGEVGQAVMINKKHNVSQYAFYFDPGDYDSESGTWTWKNYVWESRKLYNQATIQRTQNALNDTLHARGWVKLNELREALGLAPNEDGERTGWVDDGTGRKRIELGVLPGQHQIAINRKFMDVNDPLNVCIVEPNVDGCIDYIFKDIQEYDYRSGKALEKRKAHRIPSYEEMFGEECARKLGY